ncbi:hypothetical protein [Polynucleobacter sp. MWH-UH25E]|uniref:hypothetical protein n=1 Tax=Polynucleobacter sp. MWH-UH25E TaxID=1855616 RepID=UPI001BFD4F33|nr:hypothetical protein [Polynucleobacter sp. MWH-UH25E]QWD62620.1 hypothetical protein ICV39_03120 [Polynucleobacter sp. MWH-UH25E]
MKIIALLIVIFALAACTPVYTDASDSKHVTFLNADGDSIDQLTQKANAYCAQYGKVAKYKSGDSSLATVFSCISVR